MLDISRPGEIYAVNTEVANSGIPYSETFVAAVHYCLLRCGHKQSRLVVNAHIVYKKSVWGIVKSKNPKCSLNLRSLYGIRSCCFCFPPSFHREERDGWTRGEL